ncbi:MAG: PIN domain-containing protein [Acidobacteriia bacterium]|nr:PIN domain-containing protein [Terriglobia bacterium]
MKGLAFFDTNIFLYSDDAAAPEKQSKAIQLISDYQRLGLAVASLQVLQEYFSAATRKLGVDPELAQRKVELMARLRIVRFTEVDVIAAIELHRLHRISFWDAMILHGARLSGAEILFSEDFQHRSVFGCVTVVNPFAPA